jgi:hypothetical protein
VVFEQLGSGDTLAGRGTTLAKSKAMSSLELVYQYRLLLGKCSSGAGLTYDEIDELTALEAAFAASDDDQRAAEGRRFRRERVDLSAVLRGGKLHDAVTVAELAPGGLVCRSAPWAETGDAVEIVIEDESRSLSYRFKARVSWLREEHEGDDYVLGLEFVGIPVLVRYGTPMTHDPLLARIAA